MNRLVRNLGAEKLELHGRMTSLSRFLESEEFKNIDPKEQKYLIEQHKAMSRYYGILNQRLYFHTSGEWPKNHFK